MRLRVQSEISLPSGWLLLGDARALPSALSQPINGFGGLRKPSYRVFGREGLYVVDAAPRLFRAATRGDFAEVGRIAVVSGALGLCDADESVKDAAMGAIRSGEVLILPAIQDKYMYWIEARDESRSREREILAVGPSVTLLLSGPYADRIHALERAAAAALRPNAQPAFDIAELRAAVASLHREGCRDPRLRMLASVLRVDLSRRGRASV